MKKTKTKLHSPQKMDKKVHRKQNGRWNMVGHLQTSQITDMADSHRIKFTDNLRNYNKWFEVAR